MKFDEEENKLGRFNLATFSKSFGETYNKCPLKAWYTARDRNKASENTSEALEIGKYTHELFAKKVTEDYLKKTYKMKSKGIHPSIVYESKVMMSRLNMDIIIEPKDTVLAVEKFFKKYLDENGLELVGIFDLVLLKDADIKYIEIFDLKTGFTLAKKVDLQCMIYVYLATIMFPGLPIMFTTYSSKTGDKWSKYFSEKEALGLKDIILDFSTEVQEEVNSEYKPLAKCSPNCLNCPFFDVCEAAQDSEEIDISGIMNNFQFYKQKAKFYEDKLKDFRKQSDTDEPISTGTGFSIDFNETLSSSISTPKVKKDDLKVLLAKSPGGLNEILSSIDLNITDEVVNKGRELGIEFKPKITKRIVIKEESEEE